MDAPVEASLAEKLAFLRRPDVYPDRPDAVEIIETHFAWIFLSARFVYKLKKPVKFAVLDLRTANARRANCELEIALNRRLAAETYIGVVALGRRGSRLELEQGNDPVDWLVKMHRLPAGLTLERLLPGIETGDPRLRCLVETLCAYYRKAAPTPWSGPDYLRALAAQTRECTQAESLQLLAPERIAAIAASHADFRTRRHAALRSRVAQGRVCDAHGDLRPEHIFLVSRPQVIDCLEFSAELRQLDTAEELSFLGLECSKRGRSDIADALRALYGTIAGDDVPAGLFDYFRSRRALVRAMLCAWHVSEETDEAVSRHWRAQAHWYIGEAESSIARALGRAQQ